MGLFFGIQFLARIEDLGYLNAAALRLGNIQPRFLAQGDFLDNRQSQATAVT